MDMAMNQSEGEDRLSALPDAILIEILSLLPFDSLIVASTLSHHLQRLSTQVSSLTFHPRRIPDSDEVCRFWTSLKSFSRKLTSSMSRSFILDLPPLFFMYCPSSFSNSWLRQICGSSVHTIQLSSDYFGGEYYFAARSSCVFKIQSLKVLELGGCFAWNLPADPTTIRLPNLKKLSIHIVCYQLKLFGNLISSLPSLEDLSFWVKCDRKRHSHDVGDHVSFSCPKLKRLYAKVYFKSAVIVIDAPALEYIKIASYCKSGFYFVQKPALLVEAALMVRYCTCACCEGTLFHVLKSVSNVSRLVVEGHTYKGELTYSNLTTLVCELSPSVNLKLLDVLLKNCPVLQVVKLVVKADFHDWWSFSNFMLTHVKIIELKLGFKFHQPINFIKHLLSKACGLEQLNINIIVRNRKHSPWEWKPMVLQCFKGLVEYQEKLLRCHIEFSGFDVKFSCNGSKFIEELSS